MTQESRLSPRCGINETYFVNSPYILLVDDNEDDAALVFRAHRRGGFTQPLIHVEDVPAAERLVADVGLPALAIVDLRLPGHSGEDYARALAADPRMLGRPVVVHSGTLTPEKVRSLYAAGVNSVTEKATDHGELTTCIVTTLTYWLGVNVSV